MSANLIGKQLHGHTNGYMATVSRLTKCLKLLSYENNYDKPLWPGEETFPPAGHSLAKCPSSPQVRQLLSNTAKVIACSH